MNADRIKFYTELMRSLTAFILGTGAGIYAIMTGGKTAEYQYFLYFISVLCLISLGTFIAVFVYLNRKT
jgi:hypothetical protein